MCLILFAINSHPDYPFVVAANRDEFYARPTKKIDWWSDYSHVLGARDQADVLG
ncbi:MAG: NRDE family protein, partial [Polynucleobacter sp.]|nr:NRDE family protein [Polynucleobacter sp.]